MEKDSKIFVAGHRGMVGQAVTKVLQKAGYQELLLRDRQSLDLCRQEQVADFFAAEKPEYVFLAAAKVGGILANQQAPAEFLYQNLMIAANIIHASYQHGVKKLINLGSSCIYPKEAPQPIKEEYLLTGPLEPTNEAYAIAKIAAIKLCASYNQQYGTDYLSAMPCNLYGPGDNFHLKHSHLIPALIRKFADAVSSGGKEVVLWGDGTPRREFLFSEDVADAAVFLMENFSAEQLGICINVGSGTDYEIREIAEKVADLVGFDGKIVWDQTYPNGTMRKLMDSEKLRQLGWRPKVSLEEGLSCLLGEYRSGEIRIR